MKDDAMSHDKILLVDDDASAIQLMSRILGTEGDLRFATSGEDALRLARESVPDLIMLDAEMPGMSGFQTCEALKADPLLTDVPVIFVSSHGEQAFELAGLETGAADFIAKPVSPPLMLARVRTQLRLKRTLDTLRRMSATDALTGVSNRRRFDEMLYREWLRCRRSGDALSLLLIDVDHFKLFNDRHGHPAGDQCLRAVAQALVMACLRPGDLVARYGGEEFALLLPQTPRTGAERVALRVLDAVETLRVPHHASPTSRHVTVSVGAACYDEASPAWVAPSADSRFGGELALGCSAPDLVRAADVALYMAKQTGRARAMLLDIADGQTPALAREIAQTSHATQPRGTYA